MHDVSNAINILDPSKGTNNGICKTGAYNFTGAAATKGVEKEGNCGITADTSKYPQNTTGGGFDLLFKEGRASGSGNTATDGGNYHKNQTENMGPLTSAKISKDVSTLNREQKGVVSSAFAKAHEGAEIPA